MREKDFGAADNAFRAVAKQARMKALGEWETEAYRRMALYQQNPKTALELLSKASGVLEQDSGMSNAAREQLQSGWGACGSA